MTRCSTLRHVIVISVVVVCLPALAVAQASKSTVAAKELTQTLDSKKLDAVAAKDPSKPDRYAAALYFPGVQLLVFSGTYSAPALVEWSIAQGKYRDVYTELSGASPKESRIFVLDMGTPGLTPKNENAFFDTWTQGGKQVMFDGEPDKQKISEADYQKTFEAADEEYTRILGALLAQAKK